MVHGMEWSQEQIAIFDWFRRGSGAAVVVARAGSGKSSTIKAGLEVAPEASKLYTVFNRRNAAEAKEKISDPRVKILSLHGLGYGYVTKKISDCKPDDKIDFERINRLAKKIPFEVVGLLRDAVNFVKSVMVTPTPDQIYKIMDKKGFWAPRKFVEYPRPRMVDLVFQAIELSAKPDPSGRISFTDMIWLPVRHKWIYPRFDLVAIDEAQDMSQTQYCLVRGSLRRGGRQIYVGDDSQAIYSWRGAGSGVLDRLATKLEAKRLSLTTTYRCPKAVVRYVQQWVPDIRAQENAPEGEVRVVDCLRIDDVRHGDVILSRTNAPLMPFCIDLLRAGKSPKIRGEDVAQDLLKIYHKLSNSSLAQFLHELQEWKVDGLRETEDPDRIDWILDISTILTTLSGLGSGPIGIPALISQIFDDDTSKPHVLLSTVHRAKGLEWDRVFGLTDTFRGEWGAFAEREEENIAYVLCTRARSELVLVMPKKDVEK